MDYNKYDLYPFFRGSQFFSLLYRKEKRGKDFNYE